MSLAQQQPNLNDILYIRYYAGPFLELLILRLRKVIASLPKSAYLNFFQLALPRSAMSLSLNAA